MVFIVVPYTGLCLWLTRASDTQTGPHGDHPRDDQTWHGRLETAGYNAIKPCKALVLRGETAADRSLPRVLLSSSTVIYSSCSLSAPPFSPPKEDIARLPTLSRCVPKCPETKRRASADCCTSCQADCGRTRRRYRRRVIWTCWPFWIPWFSTSTANTIANQVRLPFRLDSWRMDWRLLQLI